MLRLPQRLLGFILSFAVFSAVAYPATPHFSIAHAIIGFTLALYLFGISGFPPVTYSELLSQFTILTCLIAAHYSISDSLNHAHAWFFIAWGVNKQLAQSAPTTIDAMQRDFAPCRSRYLGILSLGLSPEEVRVTTMEKPRRAAVGVFILARYQVQ